MELSDLSDLTIRRAAGGDTHAFEQIYKLFFHFVTNVSFRIVKTKEEAEEVTQEVFISLYRNLGTFRFNSSFKTWVYRITINTALNHVKKMSKHRAGVEVTENMAVYHADIEGQAQEEENQEMIDKMLNMLTLEQRTCIILRSIEQLSYQEIAETLQIPINTVRSRIKRAREILMALKKEEIKNEL